jgi:membrane protease YdiL (CAAX protease family)
LVHMTLSSARPGAEQRPGLLARHPLVAFFVMAYAFTWIVWSPWVLGQDGAGVLPVRIDPGLVGYLNAAAILAGPTVAGLIMAGVTGGRAGVRRLLARLVLWRVGARWYVVALVGVPLVMLLGTMAYAVAWPTPGALGGPSYLLSYVVSFVLVTVFGGPLFEEIGWRGFALPRMQRSMGPLVASLVLGVLWALWHLPEFLVPSWAASSGGGGVSGVVLFTITAITFTVVITWIFNNTRASLLLAVLVHSSIDTFSGPLVALFGPEAVASALPFMIGFGVLALVLVAVTRGRLSYRELEA